jgi:hypothetical protein
MKQRLRMVSQPGRNGPRADASPIDRHQGGGDDRHEPPLAEGSYGRLGYTRGCLYLEAGGGRTGLVMPRDARFDGARLTAKNLDTRLGEFHHMSGRILDNPGTYGCKMPTVLIVDPRYRPPETPEKR